MIQAAPTTASVAASGDFGGIIPLLYELTIQAPLTFNDSISGISKTRFRGRLRACAIILDFHSKVGRVELGLRWSSLRRRA